jgi:glycosyltransferase involved in cell wall biosynthesis
MKVLWFSLSPGLGSAHLNDNYKGLGWMKALEKNIQDKVELSIVFYQDRFIEPFTLGPTKYFPVNRYKHGKFSKAKRRLFNGIEDEDDVKTFVNIVNEVKPDLIHVHGTEGPFGLVQKFVDIPAVVSIQGTITVVRHKYFSAISYLNILRFSGLKDLLFFRSFVHVYKEFAKKTAREHEIYAHSKHFIGRTAWDRRVTLVLAPAAEYYHNDEILQGSFYKHQWNNKLDAKLILFTTNGPNIYKGIETLLDCAHLLDGIHINYEWHVAGLNRNDELVKIASKSIGTPVSNNIKFMGKLDEELLSQALLKAHIYISVSHIENSPNSLCEAQILGVPCIATFAGGTNTLLEDGTDGILIQDGDPYAMAGAIIEIKNNFDKAIVYGENSRKKALKRHDPEKITNDLLDIYKTILNRN